VDRDEESLDNKAENARLLRFIEAYREYGHQNAALDPLDIRERCGAHLDPRHFNLHTALQDQTYDLSGLVNIPGKEHGTFHEVKKHLEDTYCGTFSAEFMHIKNKNEKDWFASKIEECRNWSIGNEKRKEVCLQMLKSQAFDNFVGKKFMTLKRYSGEGAESMIAFMVEAFASCASYGIEDVVMCIPHRGRQNLLVGLLNYSHVHIFSKMKGNPEFNSGLHYTGDVLSHLYTSTDLDVDGKKLHVSMLPNPSHLEAANPVTVGKTRAKQLSWQEGHYGDGSSVMGDKVLCLQIHGDAAVSAQGIIMETLCLANLPHFEVGGSLHLIVNNQLGFTTPAERGSSASNVSDIVKFVDSPIIHVNGDNPEDVVRACQLAMAYRMEFRKDVVVNLLCFRRWGHNELDDPTFTNPSMYKVIHNRQSVPDLYAEMLIQEEVVPPECFVDKILEYNEELSAALAQADKHQPENFHFKGEWTSCRQARDDVVTTWDTGCSNDLLRFVGTKSTEFPEDFNVHLHLKRTHCEARVEKLCEGKNIDWATAEALAFGTLLHEGYNVRLCGQDVGRGTFSHRHCMLIDQETDELFVPLNFLSENQNGFLEVANSPLSEEAVLAFEYGMSIENPNNLIIWESQFGDFFNGAQIIIDTFITAGELKWILQSGLVMLLPHGYDGAGPEHSSCRIERFLQLSDSKEDKADSDDVNFGIVNPTTPAQYFHLLRRQIVRDYRKPLVVASPKLILRLAAATSTLDEFVEKTHFKPVLPDKATLSPDDVTNLIFCSGKHYYALDKYRTSNNIKNTAIIRIEELVPFPAELIKEELRKYPNAKEFIWCQEEHRNMGAWSFVNPRFQNLLNLKLSYCGRDVLGTPAVGISSRHTEEASRILKNAFSYT